MDKITAKAFGLDTPQLVAIARQACHEAIARNIKAGIPTTILLNGLVQTLDPTDPRLDPYRSPEVMLGVQLLAGKTKT